MPFETYYQPTEKDLQDYADHCAKKEASIHFCDFWGQFPNASEGTSYQQCGNLATHDHGSHKHITGFPMGAQYACDKHAAYLGFHKKVDRTICPKCGAKRVEGRYCETCD